MATAAAETKKKNALTLVRGNEDPEVYQADLFWFFNCYDSECGLQSVEGHMEEVLASSVKPPSVPVACEACGCKTTLRGTQRQCRDCGHLQLAQTVHAQHQGATSTKADPYNEHKVKLRSEEHERGQGTLTKGRRIWNRIVRLPWAIQNDLKLLYEPRRERPQLPDDRVRTAHRAYNAERGV